MRFTKFGQSIANMLLIMNSDKKMPEECLTQQIYSKLLNGSFPDSKVHGVNMGPTGGRQDTGGPHVGHMNLAIWIE